jgi:hypothetical protein
MRTFAPADSAYMAINVAGTNALGDYLASEITNARILMGIPTSGSGASPLGSTVPASAATPQKALTAMQLQDQVRAQELANAQILFGVPGANNAGASTLPPIGAQTPQQLANVAVQSSRIALEFSTIATLFGWNGIGANTDSAA